jgi:hypothetical protein
MASELRVDTLKDSSGNNSVGMSYVSNGSAKQWSNFVGSSTSVNDSFNTASVTDNGTGDFSPQLTNSMDNANYNVACMIKPTNSQSNQTVGRCGNIRYNEDPTTGGYRVITITTGGSPEDNGKTMTTVHGDLA